MPRNPGTGVYEQPAPDVITATTIESTVYNGFVNDVETDLNMPRPIVAGGTGATNVTQARDNLDAEVAGKQVTNYDTHVWENGSFYSFGGATGEPASGLFSGVCHMVDASHIQLQARQYGLGATAPIWTRVKSAGAWGAWTSQAAQFVDVTGDTMTGDLIIDKATPSIYLKKTASGQAAAIAGTLGASRRWAISLGDGDTESGVAVGSNFRISRFNNSDVFMDNALSISRLTGDVTIVNSVYAPLGFFNDSPKANGVYFSGAATMIRGGTDNITFESGVGAAWGRVTVSGFRLGYGFETKQGSNGAYGGNILNFFWTGTNLQAFLTDTNIGTITLTSDYRIKKDVADLPGTWEAVKALRPIKYTQAEFTPPSQVTADLRAVKDGIPPASGPMFVADDIERWGFIAHELQETLTPSAASGVKDAPDTIQAPNPFTLIAALTKALQEAMARIEALEAAQAAP